jgi:hypothetical protein
MSDGSATTEATARNEALELAYSAVCDAYHKIDDFRAKLLALLPLASGTGVFLLLNADINLSSGSGATYAAVGLFGIFTTLGLFVYELGGVFRCHRLIKAGTRLEEVLKLPLDDGHMRVATFGVLPKGALAWLRGQAAAALIIYPTVLGGWAYLVGVGWNWW